jgi:hypothetical protein
VFITITMTTATICPTRMMIGSGGEAHGERGDL